MAKLTNDEIKWVLDLDAKGVQSELTKLSSKAEQFQKANKMMTAEMKEAEKQMKEAEKAMDKLSKAGQRHTKEFYEAEQTYKAAAAEIEHYKKKIDENKKSIAEYNARHKEMVKTMKLEDMTMNQLRQRAKELSIELNKTSKSAQPEAYAQLSKDLSSVNKRMGELKGGTDAVKKEFDIFSKDTLKAVGMVSGAIVLAQKAIQGFYDIMMSNRGTQQQFKAELDGLNAGWDYMKSAIANVDFTNFWHGLKESIRLGREASIMIDELFERTNSFNLYSSAARADIEDMKIDLQDVNKPLEERKAIGKKILEQMDELAKQEREIAKQRVDGFAKQLEGQTALSEADRKYMIEDYNANREKILQAKEIIELEAKKTKNMAIGGQYQMQLNMQFNAEIQKQIDLLKQSSDFSQEAYEATKKYLQGSEQDIANFVNALEQYRNVDIKNARDKKSTARMVNSLDKTINDSEKKAIQKIAVDDKKELNKLLENLEIEHNKKLAEINQQYLDGTIKSSAELQRKQYAQEQSYFLLRESSLESFGDKASKELSQQQKQRLDKEVAFRKQLEQIIINADPIKKEEARYNESLSAFELYGQNRESLQKEIIEAGTEEQKEALQQKYDAFILLEKEHQNNLKNIRNAQAKADKQESERIFQEKFKARKEEMQLELNELTKQSELAFGSAAFDAEMAVHTQRLNMINEEIEARREAGADVQKLLAEQGKAEAALTSAFRKELQSRIAEAKQYGATIGQVTGDVMTGQKDALQAFSNVAIDILFDTLSSIIEAEIIRVTATSTAAIAETTAKQIASKGFLGIGTAAILTGLITTAMTVAKTGLKALIGKRKHSESSAEATPKKTGQIVPNSKGFADGGYHQPAGYTGDGGKYDIKGFFPDGQPYHAGEYIIPQEMVRMPSVAPFIRQIESARKNKSNNNQLPIGFADGGFHGDNSITPTMGVMNDPNLIRQLISVMQEVRDKKTYINYYEFENAKQTVDNARSRSRR